PTPQPTEPPGRQSAPSLTRAIPSPTPSSTKESPDASPEEDTLKAEVTVAAGNVRSGPGLAYPVIGQVSRGDVLVVLGRNAPGDWLQIARDDRSGWLSSSLVKLNSAITGLEVVEVLVPPPASPTPTPQPSEVPYCDSVPIRGFGTIWGEHPSVAATLGCPSWPYREQGTGAAAQTFGHGLMLWLAADTSGGGDPVYVLFDTGEYQRFPDMGPADPAVVGDIPAGFYPPGDRFSKVYWEGTGVRVRQRLGYATGPQIDSPGAYQQFWNGRMFWAGALDRIFVLYDYWQWDEPGENGVQIRSWVGFQDTFGD
ncbi:MAG: SH3 domain-containing protein, partial [Anaerolineae bacterium]